MTPGTNPLTDASSFDTFVQGASTAGDYYSAASGLATRRTDYQTALSIFVTTNPKILSFGESPPWAVASSTQQKISAKINLDLGESHVEPKDEFSGTPRTIQHHALAGAISTAMSKCLEPEEARDQLASVLSD